MREITEETKRLRDKGTKDKKLIRELNNPGKRLEWCRSKLKLAQVDVVEGTGLPASSYNGRENGVRTPYQEEYLLLAVYFTKKWTEKFIHGYFPKYEGVEIRKITVNFLQFGIDEVEENSQLLQDEFKIRLQEMEMEHIEMEMLLKSQIELFTSEIEL